MKLSENSKIEIPAKNNEPFLDIAVEIYEYSITALFRLKWKLTVADKKEPGIKFFSPPENIE